MKTFSEWMAERHPEELDEGLRDLANSKTVRGLVAAAGLTAGGLGLMGAGRGVEVGANARPAAAETETASHLSRKDKALYELAKKSSAKLNGDEQSLLSQYLKFRSMLGEGHVGPRFKAAEGSLSVLVRAKFPKLYDSENDFEAVGDYLWERMSGSAPAAPVGSQARQDSSDNRIVTRSESPDLD
jgi:hypothetical protein